MLKIVGAGLAVALLVGTGGAVLQRARFGLSDTATVARVQAELQERVDRSIESLGQIASQLASQREAIRAAPRDTATAKRLFDTLDSMLPASEHGLSGISVYSAAGAPVAWAGRVSELPRQATTRRAVTSLTSSALGLRLLRVEPLLDQTRPGAPLEATIVVEQTLGSSQRAAGSPGTFVVATSLVPVTVGERLGTGTPPEWHRFVLSLSDGSPLAEAGISPADLTSARARWTYTTAAAVLTVLAITLLLCGGPLIELRRRTRSTPTYLAATAGLAAGWLAALALVSRAGALFLSPGGPLTALDLLLISLGVAVLVWLALDLLGRRRHVHPRPQLLAPTFASALLLGGGYLASGVLAAWVLWRYERVLQAIVFRTPVDLLHFSHYSVSPEPLGLALAVALLHTSTIWMAATISRAPGVLWRASRQIVAVAAAGWSLGVLGSTWWLVSSTESQVHAAPLLVALAATGAAAAALGHLSARIRHASQAARLLWLFLALLVPAVAMYPSLAAFTINAKEQTIATRLAPGAGSLREDLQVRVQHALEQIDGVLASSPDVVARGAGNAASSDPAFRIWSQTDLAKYRLTSAVEIYGPDQRLVSHFALNLPKAASPVYGADSCDWSEFDEASPFGSNQRVLHYSRDICQRGRVQGAVVVRAMLDYRTLPFLASQSPYLGALGSDQPARPDIRAGENIEFVVYGWSRAPLFASGTSVWTLPDDVFERMVASREPEWAAIDRDGQPFRVYLFNDRSAVYALGYPVTTWFGHLSNLVELGTLILAPLYIALLGITTLFSALTSRTPSGGRALLREVRSSFYRKLFLYYVAGAVVPVVTLAVATRAYFATELRAGIDEAAAKTATVAERLVEDYTTFQQRGSGALEAIDDQVMVLVGQAIDHDANLFDRARLQATSERDLFESQLLSPRTPANIYRAILLDRLPTFVGEEQIGDVRYRLAAAPVRAGGREGVVTVPLTLQQQEIEQQIDELDHRVLFGAVLFSLLGAALGYWLAERIADPVNRLTRATRRIARGDLDARITATSSDELRRLVEDFNQMAADLKRQRADLERTQRLEAWADMARQVAHDIKNPLTPIQLSAEHARRVNIDRGRPLSPALDDCVNAILSQVRLLRQISAEFSSFASSPTPRPERTALPSLIEEVVAPYRTGLAGRIDIRVAAPADLPTVHIDRTLFARAITNVIENALAAMPREGVLTIDSRPDMVNGADGRSAVVVEIADTGVGMDEQALTKVFEPYFSTKAAGTGLGLTIAKRNVELNGGTIAVTSERGVGTTVTITVPVDAARG
ncbi:MAG: HAMP domain-containing histidine kinase [Acidobacteria bacterium]|nr:HAMP domain-containing histidine kinase [Acidobacteriota bacterium]